MSGCNDDRMISDGVKRIHEHVKAMKAKEQAEMKKKKAKKTVKSGK